MFDLRPSVARLLPKWSARIAPHGRLLRVCPLVLLLGSGGCGSAKTDSQRAATAERGTVPPEWNASQPATSGGPTAQSGTPAKPLSPASDTSGEAVVVAVDRYRDIVRGFGGQADVNLDFSRTAITDDDLARLPLPDSVRGIDLSVTQIGDAGLEHLLRARRLERLNLSGTKVTEAGARTLKKMPYLWSVNVDQSQMPLATQLELLRFFATRAEARTQARPR